MDEITDDGRVKISIQFNCEVTKLAIVTKLKIVLRCTKTYLYKKGAKIVAILIGKKKHYMNINSPVFSNKQCGKRRSYSPAKCFGRLVSFWSPVEPFRPFTNPYAPR